MLLGWRQVVNNQFKNIVNLVFQTNLNAKHISTLNIRLNSFWIEVLTAWCELNHEEPHTCMNVSLLKQCLWFNSDIC